MLFKKKVIVIGAGCAGMIAALEAQAEGAEVVIVDKGLVGTGTNSALSNAYFAGPTPHQSPEQYISLTLSVGRGINRELMVRLLAEKAPRGFSFLRSLGLKLVEDQEGFAIKPQSPDSLPGVSLVKSLADRIRSNKKIHILTGFYVTEILNNGERSHGVRGFKKTGEEIFIFAPAVVLATGGAGAIYLRSDNQKGIMGQGYYLAAKAGLDLWDMEFVQCYPLVISEPGLPSLLLYPPYPKEARLINSLGEDISRKHAIGDLNKAILTIRDRFSAILFHEGLTGPICMDYRRVPISKWKEYPLSIFRKMKFNFFEKPFAVSPAVHFFNGGVWIDKMGRTTMTGLFACGEVVGGFHGANRMGGNSLTECVVFGRIAGRYAARFALDNYISPLKPKRMSNNSSNTPFSTREMLKELRRQIREIAWRYAGVMRSQKGLQKGIEELLKVEQKLKEINPAIPDRAFNENLMSAAFVLKAVLTASLAREESRGSFLREDFPKQDDVNWRKNSCLSYDWREGAFSVKYYINI